MNVLVYVEGPSDRAALSALLRSLLAPFVADLRAIIESGRP